MQRRINILPGLFAVLAMAFASAPVRAAAYGIEDNAQVFSTDAVTQANDLIREIRSGDHRDVLVVTYPSVPADQQDSLAAKGKDRFYHDWADQIGREHRVNGIVILLVKSPGHLEVDVGRKTGESVFAPADREALTGKMMGYLKEKEFDDALVNGLKFIKAKLDEHPANSAAAPYASPPYSGSSPPPNYSTRAPALTHHFSVGGLLCVGVGILLIVFFIINAANRSHGNGPGPGANYGGGPPPIGGYPSANYGGGGYGMPGQGGGFGRGLLGGLLGGALGAWGYDQFSRPAGGSTNYTPPNSGGGDFNSGAPDSGGDFNSGTSASGGDFGGADTSSGGDFGSSDTSSGGDFGGGGDSGGGGGGGDF